MKIQNQISQKSFTPKNGFIYDYQKLIKDVVLPFQYDILQDKAGNEVEKSHVIKNFINAANVLKGKSADDGFYGMVFQDSDAAKWIEAVAYSLSIFPDSKLEQTADELIEIISDAQDTDGYLDTFFTIKDKEKRWENLLECHELYCAGHMMEAACAYAEVTGKKKILDVMLKNVSCIYNVFLCGNDFMKNGIPGHPEVELALLKMYHLTGEKKCLELAKHFIDVRGTDPDFFVKEVSRRSWTHWGSDGKDTVYNQANMPVRKMTDARGHAVRAVYLYTAMADLASSTNDEELKNACKVLWNSITQKQMYVTGGIGSTVMGEAFSQDFDLPSDTAYCETCASIGLMFFASKMLENEVNSVYSDVMEKAFYNTVIAGMQLDGKKFFYVNPLEVIPGIAGVSQTHKHDLPQRPSWYACACCPPNVARLISSFGKYAYGENEDTAFCHLFASGIVEFNNGMKLECKTNYPNELKVEYKIIEAPQNAKLAIRMPGWSKKCSFLRGTKNSSIIDCDDKDLQEKYKGYKVIKVFKDDWISIEFDCEPYIIYPSPKIPDLSGLIAVAKGPIVYCAESVDNDEIRNLFIDEQNFSFNESNIEISNKIINILEIGGKKQEICEDLYSTKKPNYSLKNITMIPYYAWGNRGENQMKVWFPCK